MATEGKYGEITASHKVFHPNEPVFLFRATDPFVIATLCFYWERCKEGGCSQDFLDQITDHSNRIAQWKADHPNLVKQQPD